MAYHMSSGIAQHNVKKRRAYSQFFLMEALEQCRRNTEVIGTSLSISRFARSPHKRLIREGDAYVIDA